jgi:hypothetical protein
MDDLLVFVSLLFVGEARRAQIVESSCLLLHVRESGVGNAIIEIVFNITWIVLFR